jgi:hypothetical protein
MTIIAFGLVGPAFASSVSKIASSTTSGKAHSTSCRVPNISNCLTKIAAGLKQSGNRSGSRTPSAVQCRLDQAGSAQGSSNYPAIIFVMSL